MMYFATDFFLIFVPYSEFFFNLFSLFIFSRLTYPFGWARRTVAALDSEDCIFKFTVCSWVFIKHLVSQPGGYIIENRWQFMNGSDFSITPIFLISMMLSIQFVLLSIYFCARGFILPRNTKPSITITQRFKQSNYNTEYLFFLDSYPCLVIICAQPRWKRKSFKAGQKVKLEMDWKYRKYWVYGAGGVRVVV